MGCSTARLIQTGLSPRSLPLDILVRVAQALSVVLARYGGPPQTPEDPALSVVWFLCLPCFIEQICLYEGV